MWKDISTVIDMTPWQVVDGDEATEIVRETQKHCPEFPFDPASVVTQQKIVPFYMDYRLVRFADASDGESSTTGREMYGFYAVGDFRPLDGTGRAVEMLNNLAPLHLTAETVMEYVLMRLKIELPLFYSDNKTSAGLSAAIIVSKPKDLPVNLTQLEEKKREALLGLLTTPMLLMVPEWESYKEAHVEQGKMFRVNVSVLVYHEDEFEVVGIFAQVSPDGLLSLSKYNKHSGRLKLDKQQKPGHHMVFPPYTLSALPIKVWQKPAGKEDDALRKALADYNVGKPTDESDPKQKAIILRKAALAFYRSYYLLEVLESRDEGYRRSYALFRMSNGELVIHPLNGTSIVIHEINKEDDERNINEQTAPDYLRFFCWAVHGDHGPFYIPLRAFRELPLLLAPSTEQRVALNKVDFTIRNVPEEEIDSAGYSKFEIMLSRLKTHVAYELAVFEAWFGVESKGMVHMVSDKTQVTNLAIAKVVYGSGDLFILKKSAAAEPGRDPSARTLEQSPLVQRVSWVNDLKYLNHLWSKLPADQEVSLQDARQSLPQLSQPLKTLLSEFPDLVSSNDALRFLHALSSEPSADQKILPAVFLRAVETLLAQLRPTQKVGKQEFLKSLRGEGQEAPRLVGESVILNTESLQTSTHPEEKKSHDPAEQTP